MLDLYILYYSGGENDSLMLSSRRVHKSAQQQVAPCWNKISTALADRIITHPMMDCDTVNTAIILVVCLPFVVTPFSLVDAIRTARAFP